jgi:hypothetical protein
MFSLTDENKKAHVKYCLSMMNDLFFQPMYNVWMHAEPDCVKMENIYFIFSGLDGTVQRACMRGTDIESSDAGRAGTKQLLSWIWLQ